CARSSDVCSPDLPCPTTQVQSITKRTPVLTCFSLLPAEADTVSWPLCSSTRQSKHTQLRSVRQNISRGFSCWVQILSCSWLNHLVFSPRVYIIVNFVVSFTVRHQTFQTGLHSFDFSPSADVTLHISRSSSTWNRSSSLDPGLLYLFHKFSKKNFFV